MEPRDCDWCGSAKSVERGVCQVCLMRFPEPDEASRVIDIQEAPGAAGKKEPERPAAGETQG